MCSGQESAISGKTDELSGHLAPTEQVKDWTRFVTQPILITKYLHISHLKDCLRFRTERADGCNLASACLAMRSVSHCSPRTEDVCDAAST